MLTVYNLDVGTGSPRVIFRESLGAGILTQEQFDLFIEALANRNLTSHIYNQDLAQEIADRIPDYYDLMETVLSSIEIKN